MVIDLEALRPIRYSGEEGYFFILDPDGNPLLSPLAPGRETAPGTPSGDARDRLVTVRAGGFRLTEGFIDPFDLVAIGFLTAEEAEVHAALEPELDD